MVFQEKKKTLFLVTGAHQVMPADAACARRDLRQGGWEHQGAGCRGLQLSFHLLGYMATSNLAGILHIAIIICPYMHGTLLQYHVASDYFSLARASDSPVCLHLPGLRRFFSTLMETQRSPLRRPEGPPRDTPVGQVALTGQTDRPEWILRWLEPP